MDYGHYDENGHPVFNTDDWKDEVWHQIFPGDHSEKHDLSTLIDETAHDLSKERRKEEDSQEEEREEEEEGEEEMPTTTPPQETGPVCVITNLRVF